MIPKKRFGIPEYNKQQNLLDKLASMRDYSIENPKLQDIAKKNFKKKLEKKLKSPKIKLFRSYKKNEKEKQFKEIYNSDLIKKKYWDGRVVKNHYGKVIEADEFHSVNYIVQSTTAGLALRQALKVNELLKGSQSKIKIVIHDNIVIDMKKEDKHLIQQIVDVYNNTEFGKFKSSVKIGKTLGVMRKII